MIMPNNISFKINFTWSFHHHYFFKCSYFYSMEIELPDTWPQFYTATIAEWRPLLELDKYKDIIIESFWFLVQTKRVILYGFVIMKNHVHVIWQATKQIREISIADKKIISKAGLESVKHPLQKVQDSFLKFTAQQIKFDLIKNHPNILALYKVNGYDRNYNFWKRRSLGIELFTPAVFKQKLDYIHRNPVKAGLCSSPEEYYYSSAGFYTSCIDRFNMLTRYEDSLTEG